MASPSIWVTLATATLAAAAAIIASVVTQRMTARRERELRRTEAETKRRHQVEDLQRATLVDLQDSLRELLNETQAVTSIFILERTTRSPVGRPFEGGIGLGEIRKSNGQFMASQARVFTLMSRVQDTEAKTLALKVVELCQVAKNGVGETDDQTALLNPAFNAFVAANRRTGDLILALDEAAKGG
jgi:hypothetical protein